jgi:hypothetical protein
MVHAAPNMAQALSSWPSPLLFAAVGDRVALACLGTHDGRSRMGELADAMASGVDAMVVARAADPRLRVDVALAGGTLALVRPDLRAKVLRRLPALLNGIAPPDWTSNLRAVMDRAVVELLAGRPVHARRCARVLRMSGEPDAARWVRIAADQVQHGVSVVNLEAGLMASMNDHTLLSAGARLGARLLSRLPPRRAARPSMARSAP